MRGGRGVTLGIDDTVERGMGIALNSMRSLLKGGDFMFTSPSVRRS